MITLRRLLLGLAVTVGVTAATAGPAAAGLYFRNHCRPGRKAVG